MLDKGQGGFAEARRRHTDGCACLYEPPGHQRSIPKRSFSGMDAVVDVSMLRIPRKLSSIKYGQTYLCISIDLDTIAAIADQMINH